MRSLPLAGFFALSLLWGSEWMLTTSLPSQPVLMASAVRYAMAAVVLLPWAVRDRFWQVPLRNLGSTVVLGVCILCLPQILIVQASRGLPSVLSLASLAAVPLLLAVAGRGNITTAVCGLGGVLFLGGSELSLTLREAPWLLCSLAAAALLALGLAKAEGGCRRMSLTSTLFVQCSASALLLYVAASILERRPVEWSSITLVGFAAGALLPAVCGYLLFYWLIDKLGAAAVSMLQWTLVLIATIESTVLMRLRPGWEPIFGALLIVIALIRGLSNRSEEGVTLQMTRE